MTFLALEEILGNSEAIGEKDEGSEGILSLPFTIINLNEERCQRECGAQYGFPNYKWAEQNLCHDKFKGISTYVQ